MTALIYSGGLHAFEANQFRKAIGMLATRAVNGDTVFEPY